jgi:hypothetical protein
MGVLICEIDGQEVQAPENWQGVQTLMTWDNESVQANITTLSYVFVGDAVTAIKSHLATKGYFVKLPVLFKNYEDDGTLTLLDGYIDFTEGYRDLTPNDDNQNFKVECTFKNTNQIDTFKAKAEGTTFALLEEQGYILSTDFERLLYVLQKPRDPMEELMLAIMIFQSALTLAQIVKDATNITLTTGALLGTAGFGSAIAAPVYAALAIIAEIIYITIALIQLVLLLNKMLQILLPMPRFGRVLSLRKYMQKACAGLGSYNFNSSIPQLDSWYIFPSKDKVIDNNPFNSSSTDTGYFNIKDNGYLVKEFFDNCEKIFRAKFKIEGNEVYFEPLLNDSFWLSKSTYQMPDVFISAKSFNTDEMNGTHITKFATDDLDVWTKEKYSGTSYEVHTESTTASSPRESLIKGYNEVSIQWALGNTKDTKNIFEDAVSGIATLITNIADIFGSNQPTIASAFKNITSALKISQDTTNLPKLVACKQITEANRPFLVLQTVQRDVISAEIIYNLFGRDVSFVSGNNRNQWYIFNDVRVKFNQIMANEIGNNNFFVDLQGNEARMEKVLWNSNEDFATLSYRVRGAYDTNLKETIITT